MNENWKPMNVKDIPAIEEKLRAAIRTNTFAEFAAQYEGPAFGIDFREETGKVSIHDGWYADENGDIRPKK